VRQRVRHAQTPCATNRSVARCSSAARAQCNVVPYRRRQRTRANPAAVRTRRRQDKRPTPAVAALRADTPVPSARLAVDVGGEAEAAWQCRRRESGSAAAAGALLVQRKSSRAHAQSRLSSKPRAPTRAVWYAEAATSPSCRQRRQDTPRNSEVRQSATAPLRYTASSPRRVAVVLPQKSQMHSFEWCLAQAMPRRQRRVASCSADGNAGRPPVTAAAFRAEGRDGTGESNGNHSSVPAAIIQSRGHRAWR